VLPPPKDKVKLETEEEVPAIILTSLQDGHMGSAVGSAAVARRYSCDRKINQTESDSEAYFCRGKGCSLFEMVS
jgi:hypothetical protein